MSDKLQFVAGFHHSPTAESPDKLKFVGHFPSLPAVSLGTALVVIRGFYRLPVREMQWASFPSMPEYRIGLPKRSRAPALQRLRRSDLCACFGLIPLVWSGAPNFDSCLFDCSVCISLTARAGARFQL